MTGSLQVKNGKFYLVINTYINGKRKLKWIPTGLSIRGNKKRAEQMLRDALKQYEMQEGITHSDMLYSEYIRYWLTQVARRVDAVTLQGYEILAKNHIIPYFEGRHTKLQDVTRQMLQEYIDTKSRSGLSPASMRLHKNILHQSLKEAVKDNLLLNNPCEYVELPKAERYDYKFFTAQQLKAFLDAIHDEELYPFIKITAIYGLRRSEALGIKWDSIDFENGTLTIKHTVSKVVTAVEKDKTKNAASHRTFPLVDDARYIFEAAKARGDENRKLFGSEYHENEYVFKWDDGTSYSPDYITRKFSRLLKQYGFPHIRFHELRHSCASLLIAQGFTLKDVQEWLGHSDIKMTANIYSHLDASRKQSIADRMEKMLG